MDTKKVSLIIAIGALVVSIIAVYVVLAVSPSKGIPIGAIGTLLVEDYIPVIKYNDGYYSALDITTTGTITGATISGTTVTPTTLTVSGATDVGTFTQGGGTYSSSTSGAVVPLLATAFDTENMLDITLNVQDATLSFPATTTLTSFLPSAGDTRTLFVRNATTTAAMDLTISGGTGVLMKQATSTSVTIPGDTDGGNFAVLQLIRKVNTDIELLVQVFKD